MPLKYWSDVGRRSSRSAFRIRTRWCRHGLFSHPSRLQPFTGIHSNSSAADYGPALTAFIQLGRSMDFTHYQRAAMVRDEFRVRLREVFSTVDMIVLPTQSLAGPSSAHMHQLLAEPGSVAQLARYTCAFDMAGSPLLVLPGGRTRGGVPISFQLIGPDLSEERLIAIGRAYQDATSWHLHRPNL